MDNQQSNSYRRTPETQMSPEEQAEQESNMSVPAYEREPLNPNQTYVEETVHCCGFIPMRVGMIILLVLDILSIAFMGLMIVGLLGIHSSE